MKEDPESKKKNSDFDAIQTKIDSAEQCNAQPKGTTQIQKNQQRKSTQYIWDQKPSFLLQFTQVINQFMKFAALPRSFDSKLKMCSWHTSILDTTKIKFRSDKELQPSRVLYIGTSKRLNDYYAPRT
jgi:hypothetical protein